MIEESITDDNKMINDGTDRLIMPSFTNDENIYNNGVALLNTENSSKNIAGIIPFVKNDTKQVISKEVIDLLSTSNEKKCNIGRDIIHEMINNKGKHIDKDKYGKDFVNIYVKLVTEDDVKLPSHDKRKRQNVKYVDNKAIYESTPFTQTIIGPFKKNDFRLNDNVFVTKKPQNERNTAIELNSLRDTINLFSIPCGREVTPPKKKARIIKSLREEKNKKITEESPISNNVLKENKKNEFSSSGDSFKKNNENISHVIGKTLNSIYNFEFDNVLMTNGVRLLDTFFSKDSNSNINGFFHTKQDSEINKKLGFDDTFQRETRRTFTKIEVSNVNIDNDSHLERRNDNYGTNDDKNKDDENLLSNNVKNLLSKENESSKSYEIVCKNEFCKQIEENEENFAGANQSNNNKYSIPRTIVKISKADLLIRNMKSRNVPISPLVTECKPLQEITFHDLYGSVGFNKLYPYPKASLNVCRNNAFISPLKMLPHEGHLIASSNINLKQSNLSPKKEENYQICTRDLHQQPLQRSSSIQYVYFGLFDNQLSDSEDTQEGGSGLLEPFDNQLLERNVDRNISHQIGIDSLLFAEEGDSPDNVFSDTDDAYYCQQDLPILDLLDSNNHNIDDGNDLCDLASTIEY